MNKQIEILLDIQGALEEDIEYKKGVYLIKNYIKYLLKYVIFYRAINSVDGVFVVSDELGEYCKSYLSRNKKDKFKTYKIRCGINEVISTEQKIQWRNKIRKKWGIDEDTVVMVFSGYRMPWQNIDRIIELFKTYDRKIEKVFFVFFCNLDKAFQERIEMSFPKDNYAFKFLSFSEYFEYLCGCDIGFLIRDYNITNKVAFPNKFSDYLNAGLMVAINKSLPEPYRILKENNIDFIDLDDENNKSFINKLYKRQNNIVEYYKKSECLCEKELLYSTQIGNIWR